MSTGLPSGVLVGCWVDFDYIKRTAAWPFCGDSRGLKGIQQRVVDDDDGSSGSSFLFLASIIWMRNFFHGGRRRRWRLCHLKGDWLDDWLVAAFLVLLWSGTPTGKQSLYTPLIYTYRYDFSTHAPSNKSVVAFIFSVSVEGGVY
jgi:hypothetical protein